MGVYLSFAVSTNEDFASDSLRRREACQGEPRAVATNPENLSFESDIEPAPNVSLVKSSTCSSLKTHRT